MYIKWSEVERYGEWATSLYNRNQIFAKLWYNPLSKLISISKYIAQIAVQIDIKNL